MVYGDESRPRRAGGAHEEVGAVAVGVHQPDIKDGDALHLKRGRPRAGGGAVVTRGEGWQGCGIGNGRRWRLTSRGVKSDGEKSSADPSEATYRCREPTLALSERNGERIACV